MKFKAGDEVLVKAKIVEFDLNRMMYLCELQEEDCLIRFYCPKDFIADKTYESGLRDAWELAKKIALPYGGNEFMIDSMFTASELESIFGSRCYDEVLSKFTVEEALAKIEAYEKEKEIKPMDVVEHIGKEWIVSQVNDSEYLLWDGRNVIHVDKGTVKKVGSIGSIEQLTKLLRQIGE